MVTIACNCRNAPEKTSKICLDDLSLYCFPAIPNWWAAIKHCGNVFANRFEHKDSHKGINTRDHADNDTETQYLTNGSVSLNCVYSFTCMLSLYCMIWQNNWFPWLNIVVLWFKCHRRLFLRSKWRWVSSVAPNRRQAISLINDGLVYWPIFASLGFVELIYWWVARVTQNGSYRCGQSLYTWEVAGKNNAQSHIDRQFGQYVKCWFIVTWILANR